MPTPLPTKVQQYMVRITNSIPGGVQCKTCNEFDTQKNNRLRYRECEPMVYEIIQETVCNNCGQLQRYSWKQDFRHRPSITIPFRSE